MKKLKLNKLSDHLFDKRQMDSIKGGEAPGPCGCCCACAYANQGGSSKADNGAANHAGGLYSSPGCSRDAVVIDTPLN